MKFQQKIILMEAFVIIRKELFMNKKFTKEAKKVEKDIIIKFCDIKIDSSKSEFGD